MPNFSTPFYSYLKDNANTIYEIVNIRVKGMTQKSHKSGRSR